MEIALERLPRESIAASSLPSVISEILFIVFALVVVVVCDAISITLVSSSRQAYLRRLSRISITFSWLSVGRLRARTASVSTNAD